MAGSGNILLAFDGSAQSIKALDEAVRLAKGLKMSLIVLHVYWNEGADAYIDPKMIATEEMDVEGRIMFEKLDKRLKDSGVDYRLVSERSTDAPQTIIEMAEKKNCEMIIVGNRGVGRVRGFILGSVAEKVATGSKRSVLIVK